MIDPDTPKGGLIDSIDQFSRDWANAKSELAIAYSSSLLRARGLLT